MINSDNALDIALEMANGELFLVEVATHVYRSCPRLSQSELKLISDKSPAHMMYQKAHPRSASEEMKLGTAAHMAILEPDRFAETYEEEKLVNKRTKKGREELIEAQKAAFKERKIILPGDRLEQARAIAREIRAHPVASHMLRGGVAERASFARVHGVDAKILSDYYLPNAHELIDLKTTKCASLNDFQRDIREYRYHWQAAWYSDVIEKLTGKMPTFKIIAIESAPPYCTAIYEIDFDLMSIARREIMEALAKLQTARESGWYGYPLQVQRVSARHWEWERFKEKLQDAGA